MRSSALGRVYPRVVSRRAFGPDGRRTGPPDGPPPAGARFVTSSDLYVGDHLRHAQRSSGTARFTCMFTTRPGVATCNGRFAIRGSSLLATDVSVSLGPRPVSRIAITGGTGLYRHARGTATRTKIGTTRASDDVFTFTA